MKNNKFLPSQKSDIEAVNSLSSSFKSLFSRYTSFYSLLVAMLLFSSCGNDETPVTPTPPAPTSAAKTITSFIFTAADNSALSTDMTATVNETAKTITATVPVGTVVTALVPTIVVADKATVSPLTNVAGDFTNALTYTVTAENGTTQAYTVTVTMTVVSQFTVTFDTNGGTPATIASQTVDSGAMATAPAVPTRTGYTFDGWFAPSSTTVAFDFATATITADLTLMAQWTINTYSVTFDTNGGTPATIASQTVDSGAMATAPADPTRTGFTFGGWVAPSATTIFDFATATITADLTLMAQWTINTYSVTFDTNGGIPATIASQTVDSGAMATAPAVTTRNGYTFGGWVAPSATVAFDFATAITENLTLTAQWTQQFTVTFDSNQGSTVAPIKVDKDTKVTAPAVPTRSSFTFGGWYTETALTNLFNFTTTDITRDITLYAKWTAATGKQFTVTFNSNQGNAVDPLTVAENGIATAPAIPTRNGYAFDGWYKDVATTTANKFNFTTTPITEEITLYAKWTQQFTITFDMNGGTSAIIDAQTVDSGTMASEPSDPTQDGFTFDGWFDPSSTTVSFDFTATAITADLTLMARWTINTYSVTFEANGGIPATIAAQTVNWGTMATKPTDPTRSGFTFGGWFAPSATTVFDFATSIAVNLTLTARWTAVATPQVTVRFDTDGGNTVDPLTVDKDTQVTKPADPVLTDATFGGWYTEPALTNLFDFTPGITADMTLYAKWTITYNIIENPTVVALVGVWDNFNDGGINNSDFIIFDLPDKKGNANKITSIAVTNVPQPPQTWYIIGKFNRADGTKVNDYLLANKVSVVLENGQLKVTLEQSRAGYSSTTSNKINYSYNEITQLTDGKTPVGQVLDWSTIVTTGAVVATPQFTVTFDSNQGSDVAAITVDSGAMATAPTNPTRSGFTFDGWFAPSSATTAFDFATPITANLTLTAKWTAVVATGLVTIPDANFRAYLKDKFPNAFNTQDEMDINHVDITGYNGTINVNSKGIADLTGIEYFTSLTSLSCFDNMLTSLDVSKNTALTSLNCSGNSLDRLDVSKNTALTSLNCAVNKLTELDVSKNTLLTILSCNTNPLTSLDVSKNTALTSLNCSGNSLDRLDVSKNTALTSLNCAVNKLTELDVSKNTLLTILSCYTNPLTSLDVSKNTALTSLNCSGNSLDRLDVSKNTALTSLNCAANKLTELDVSKNTLLTGLNFYNNKLMSLDVSKNTALTELACGENDLMSLDLRGIKGLTSLRIDAGNNGKNPLETLFVHTALQANDEIKEVKTNRANEVIIATYNDNNMLVCNNYDPNKDQCLGLLTELTLTIESKDYPINFDEDKKATITLPYQMTASPMTVAVKSIAKAPNTTASVAMGENLMLINGKATITVTDTTDANNMDSYEVSVDVGEKLALTSFTLKANDNGVLTTDIIGTIAPDATITIVVPAGTDLSALTPTILHDGMSSITPTSGVAQNFNSPVIYTLTLQDNSTQTYRTRILVTIPDDNFRAYLTTTFPYTFNAQNEMDINHALVTGFTGGIDVSRKNIVDLAGIEYFTSLTVLSCFYNMLTSLDVSKNTLLTELNCNGNSLTSLDVRENTGLTYLDCSNNALTSLDVRQNTVLMSLYCSNNALTSLDVRQNTVLAKLACGSNKLTELDVSKNTALISLICSNNSLTSLDVSKNTALISLICSNNSLTSLDIHVQGTWTSLTIYRVTSFVSPNPQLAEIKVHESQKCNTAIKDVFNANKATLDMKIITYPEGSDIGTTLDEAAYTAACP